MPVKSSILLYNRDLSEVSRGFVGFLLGEWSKFPWKVPLLSLEEQTFLLGEFLRFLWKNTEVFTCFVHMKRIYIQKSSFYLSQR